MKTGAVSLVLSALALGVAAYALTRPNDPQPQRAPERTDRVAVLEAQVAELTREIQYLKSGRAQRSSPDRLPGIPALPSDSPRADGVEPESLASGGEINEELTAIVDTAVDRKTRQVMDELRIKANKKPAINDFASVLELTNDQRTAAERVVVDGQRELHAILNMPTANGTILMDELVDIVAKGMAEPGKDHGFGKWFGRILTEKIPGTDATYATRIESVKNNMRETFKRDWSKEQYREFEEWKVDPTEIEQVPDSPNVALVERIKERARTFGAVIPDEKEK